jgi:hypothetical protein
MRLGNVKDVAGFGFRKPWDEFVLESSGHDRRTQGGHDDGLDGLGTAPTGDARRRTGAIIALALLIARARLGDDQREDPRRADRQQRNDEGEAEAPHTWILASASTYVRTSVAFCRQSHESLKPCFRNSSGDLPP